MSSPGRSPRDSLTEKTEIVLPQYANAIGTAFGGTIMSWIDICAAVSAQRHCGRVAVTASVDALTFLAPIRLGDVVILKSRVNAVFRTSMEVEVTVEREDTATRQRVLCANSLLTFVNIGDDGRPCPIPPLVLETEEDRARDAGARQRRARRLAARSGRSTDS
ncbi:MAG: acyl-CoA thioesterase [Gemmatimonadetes bacterium]|nr:MAG: acyl-CoA thioesterase [Gemmatimonadota bacterium]